MPGWQQFYKHNAAEYDQLVSREDYQKNIPRALDQICSFEGVDLVEFGAGTGRFTCMLAPVVRRLWAFDASRHMLRTAVAKLEKLALSNWLVSVADNHHLPIGDQVADVAIAGWTFSVFTTWQQETWRTEVGLAVAEMKRVLRPGGTGIILEALGWQETPQVRPEFAPYFAWLEGEQGFRSTWIRTDLKFESLAEAETLARLFFGDALADRMAEEKSLILPECTGVWWVTV